MEANKFRIVYCSDLDYEEMVADICYEDNQLALISQENGIDNMEIEIFPIDYSKSLKFSLNQFIEVLNIAANGLKKRQKFPE